MAIHVRFFASLREQLPDAPRNIDSTGIATVADVWAAVTRQHSMPEHVLCSVNFEYRDHDDAVHDGDEVAFFPPVTGG